jgi:hypothetical protein
MIYYVQSISAGRYVVTFFSQRMVINYVEQQKEMEWNVIQESSRTDKGYVIHVVSPSKRHKPEGLTMDLFLGIFSSFFTPLFRLNCSSFTFQNTLVGVSELLILSTNLNVEIFCGKFSEWSTYGVEGKLQVC